MEARFSDLEFQKIKEILVIYGCALRGMQTRVDNLLEDFRNLQPYNPIEHVKTRLKTPESIAKKLQRRGYEPTAQNAMDHLTDLAGIRCICSYNKDIYQLAAVFKRQKDLKILQEKDYVTVPKPSGYRSYHLIIEMPVHLTERSELLPVEVQIRTQAMDFWATLEHKVRYKYNNQMPEHLTMELIECAEKISELDNRMNLIQEIVDIAY